MSMAREAKAEAVRQMSGVFETAPTIIVACYQGLDMAALDDLRASLAESGALFRVTKNSLAKRALEGLPHADDLAPLFKGPTAIAWGSDPTSIPKALVACREEHEEMRIVGGVVNGAAVSADAIERLAKLPPLDALRAKIVGLLQAPAAKLVGQIQSPPATLARLLQAHASSAAD